MKKLSFLLLSFFVIALTFSCKEEESKLGNVNESLADTAGYFRYQEQSWISDSKTVGGSVTLFGNTNIGTPDTMMFVFRNFNLNGDAENVDVRAAYDHAAPTANFISVGSLKGKSGNFLYKKAVTVQLYSSGSFLLYNTSSGEKFGHLQWSF